MGHIFLFLMSRGPGLYRILMNDRYYVKTLDSVTYFLKIVNFCFSGQLTWLISLNLSLWGTAVEISIQVFYLHVTACSLHV